MKEPEVSSDLPADTGDSIDYIADPYGVGNPVRVSVRLTNEDYTNLCDLAGIYNVTPAELARSHIRSGNRRLTEDAFTVAAAAGYAATMIERYERLRASTSGAVAGQTPITRARVTMEEERDRLVDVSRKALDQAAAEGRLTPAGEVEQNRAGHDRDRSVSADRSE